MNSLSSGAISGNFEWPEIILIPQAFCAATFRIDQVAQNLTYSRRRVTVYACELSSCFWQ